MGRRIIPKKVPHPQAGGFSIKVQHTNEEYVLGPNPGIPEVDTDAFFEVKRLQSGEEIAFPGRKARTEGVEGTVHGFLL